MGLLKKIDDFFVKRKDEAADKKAKNPFKKQRKDIIKCKCKECGNDRMWYREGIYKCTKCHHVIRL